MYKRAAVPGDGALHAEKGGALESESSHPMRPLAAAVGVSAFDVSRAAHVRRRVTFEVCKPGSGRRELAQGLGSRVETVRESSLGLCERGDVRSESPQALYEAHRHCTRSQEDTREAGDVMRRPAQDVDEGAESMRRRAQDREEPGRRPRDAGRVPLRGRKGEGRAFIGHGRGGRGPVRGSPGHFRAGRGHLVSRDRLSAAGPPHPRSIVQPRRVEMGVRG